MSLPKIIQIEVTTHCQLRCIFCPHTILAKGWDKAHLSWETFSSLLPFVRHTKLIHLQGWGEPLLHPRIWDMAAAIKEKRGRVSLTTNALLMDETAAREICQIGIDLVAISVAGARAETNDSLRVGSHFERICENISNLCRLESRPQVHLVMQMMKPNIDELPELITLAARLGVDEVIAPNLDYAPTENIDTLKVFDRSPDPQYIELTEEARRKGKELGIKVHIFPLSPRDDILMCDADPAYNVWICVSGEVAPCPYVALSFRERIPRLFWGKIEYVDRFSFGNVSAGLDRVLDGNIACSFRQVFSRRLLADKLGTVADAQVSSMPKVSSSSVGFFESLAQILSFKRTSVIPPPPDLCRNCYKMYGL
jgi:MoaA/NifB/PqqE/SkfB family radical SAM enzyme